MDRSERIGLGVATAGHVLLFGVLSLGLLATKPPPLLSPPAIDVDLVDAVALESRMATPPSPPPAAQAPEEGPSEPEAVTPPPTAEPEPAPTPTPIVTPTPPRPAPTPTPVRVEPKPQTPAPARPAPAAKPAPPKPAPAKAPPPRASRLGPDFLKGLDDAPPASRATPAPAGNAPFGPDAARALTSEINRQLKPFWRPPSGADADLLVTLLSVRLDRNGTVIGEPEVVEQRGLTASNRAQASLHAERAIQAVMRASPFRNLPPELYDQWNWIKPLRFDARLAR